MPDRRQLRDQLVHVSEFTPKLSDRDLPNLTLLRVERRLGLPFGRPRSRGILPRPVLQRALPQPLAPFRRQAFPFRPVAAAGCDPAGIGGIMRSFRHCGTSPLFLSSVLGAFVFPFFDGRGEPLL